jgi:hypothetical protein
VLETLTLLAQSTPQSLPTSWRLASTLAALGVAIGTAVWATQANRHLEKLEPPSRRTRVRIVLWALCAVTGVGTLLAIASLWEIRAVENPLSYSTPTLVMLVGGAIGVRMIRAFSTRAR